ncbi:pentapeptide repeat-containing protein [Amycolatopsis pittospori]|uniref:pentapeptide repeat-containing protein n=1 Tax=Amycolatopsis pittospori TaxID=2749434 RepID=UPI001A9EBC38|nr:pentapeptide repeat-containing protein [Amycolatopsis pittospori]
MVMVGVHVVAALVGVALGVGAIYLLRIYIEGVRRDRRERPALVARGLRLDRWENAVEMMESEDAAERLECFAALERCGREEPDVRQDVVELICAYLRKPFVYPVEDEAELEVRLAAQRFLTRHFRWPLGEARPFEFWEVEELGLRDAVLVEPDFADTFLVRAELEDSLIVRGNFRRTRFSPSVNFERACFTGDTDFRAASFPSYATFAGALFSGTTTFADARFETGADFTDARVEQPDAAHSWPSPWRPWANSPVAQARLIPMKADGRPPSSAERK